MPAQIEKYTRVRGRSSVRHTGFAAPPAFALIRRYGSDLHQQPY
jgi:hypothetical protein